MNIYLAGANIWEWVLEEPLRPYRERERESKKKTGKPSMKIYLAGGVEANLKPLWKEEISKKYGGGAENYEYQLLDKVDLNILESFYYNEEILTKAIPYIKNFMLDSGAFTFFTSAPKNFKWEEYVDRYAAYINENNVNLFFELDIDPLVGYPEVLKLRSRLEKLVNKSCIPVWHKSRGKEEFIKMCQQYKYVAIGGIVSQEIKRDEYKYFPIFINTAHKYGAKIHGLGFTNLEGIRKYHFDSVDSTAWVSGNRFGAVYKFNGKTMVKVNKPEGFRLADSRKVAVNNFNEWVKFCRYAEKNL